MMAIDGERRAELVESIHQPWKATLDECLRRWRALDPPTRARSYLVVEGDEPFSRHTLNANRIAELAVRLAAAPNVIAAR